MTSGICLPRYGGVEGSPLWRTGGAGDKADVTRQATSPREMGLRFRNGESGACSLDS